MIPRGYRIVYTEPLREIGWCLPFGIHYVAILIRRIWIWTFVWPRPDWLEEHDVKLIRLTLIKHELEEARRKRRANSTEEAC
jgi:hypothetical protein